MKIAIETNVAAPIADAWRAFNNPDDIVQWDACDEWHTAWALNDLKVGGKLLLRIEANDGGMGFDFDATYTQIELNRLIEFREDDDRMVRLEFIETDAGVTICQTFDTESKHPEDQQRLEWQAVLNRFAGCHWRLASAIALARPYSPANASRDGRCGINPGTGRISRLQS